MAAYGRTESFRNFTSGGSRSAKKGYELVPARVGNQFSFTQVRAGQVEDRAQHRLGVRLTKLVGEPSIVIDVSDEQRYRTTRRSGLGDRCRGGIDEGVVSSEPSLLVQKNEMLLRAGRSQPRPRWLRVGGLKTTVRAEGRMTQGKSGDLCHIAFIEASFCRLSRP
jgi:hypothetical protein